MNYRVWCPDDGDRPEKPNMSATQDLIAATEWVRASWSELDYPKRVDVWVEDERGLVRVVSVAASWDVSFESVAVRRLEITT